MLATADLDLDNPSLEASDASPDAVSFTRPTFTFEERNISNEMFKTC
jgi:hypothetical protein